MWCKSNSHKTSSALGLPMTGLFFFFFKQYICKRPAYRLAFQVLGKAVGWPRAEERLALALCRVGPGLALTESSWPRHLAMARGAGALPQDLGTAGLV